MTKSEFIAWLARHQTQLDHGDAEQAVSIILESMGSALAEGERIEIRGFGSFSLRYRSERIGRNPRNGDVVPISARYVPHFKPGKQLREEVDSGDGADG